jgi:hypothetical protein
MSMAYTNKNDRSFEFDASKELISRLEFRSELKMCKPIGKIGEIHID